MEDITPVTPDEDFNARQRLGASPESDADRFAHLDRLADWMDTHFHIPGTNIRFGMDTILGLVPWLGDGIAMLISFTIVHAAHRHGVPHRVKARMVFNIAIDWLIGSIPVLGDIFDVAWQANRMNVALLRKHADLTK